MQPMPVVRIVDGRRTLQRLRWGMRLKRDGDDSLVINARLETLRERPSFRALVEHNRCLVPADGFYEWRGSGRHKTPLLFAFDDDRPFAFAGLWMPDKDGDAFAIVTRAPNDVVKGVHDRMPLLLRPDEHAAWLGDGEGGDAVDLDAFAGARDFAGFAARPVSPRLGNVDNDDASVLDAPLTLF